MARFGETSLDTMSVSGDGTIVMERQWKDETIGDSPTALYLCLVRSFSLSLSLCVEQTTGPVLRTER